MTEHPTHLQFLNPPGSPGYTPGTRTFPGTMVCPIFIGRQLDLTALYLLIDRLKSGQGHVVLISGEAGIGKSRLVAEAKTYATEQGFLLLQGNCFPTDRSSPYAPLLDLLRSSQAKELLTSYIANREPLARDLALLDLDLVPLP